VEFEENNPVTDLISDRARGLLDPEVLDEKVMSAIIEFQVPIAEVGSLLALLGRLARELDTVMSIGVAGRCDEQGRNDLETILPEHGFPVLRAKTNLGLGRPAAAAQA
jgi:hypothetical protein